MSKDFDNFRHLNYQDSDDVVIDFNTLFLNSGIIFNVKSDSKIKININHKTQTDFTIFQNNYFNFKKNCEVILEDNFDLFETYHNCDKHRRPHP